MAKKTKWVKPVLIVGGLAVVVLFGVPVLMNYLRPGGTVNPNLPLSQQNPAMMATLMPSVVSGIW